MWVWRAPPNSRRRRTAGSISRGAVPLGRLGRPRRVTCSAPELWDEGQGCRGRGRTPGSAPPSAQVWAWGARNILRPGAGHRVGPLWPLGDCGQVPPWTAQPRASCPTSPWMWVAWGKPPTHQDSPATRGEVVPAASRLSVPKGRTGVTSRLRSAKISSTGRHRPPQLPLTPRSRARGSHGQRPGPPGRRQPRGLHGSPQTCTGRELRPTAWQQVRGEGAQPRGSSQLEPPRPPKAAETLPKRGCDGRGFCGSGSAFPDVGGAPRGPCARSGRGSAAPRLA